MSVDVLPLNPSTVAVDENYAVVLLHEFGETTDYLDIEKLTELWNVFKEHDVLFTDTILGDLEAFVDILMSPRSVWFEIYSLEESRPVGVSHISGVIPGYDAKGHFAVWDGRARKLEGIVLKNILWVMDRYKLHRVSSEIPSYQSGTIRFVQRLGFKSEGLRREGILRNGAWGDLEMFGLLRSELEEDTNAIR